MENTEKLISLVRENVFLWAIDHRDYKNAEKKTEKWTEIGKELNLSGQTVSKKWKNLKDSYNKYLKSMKGSTGSDKKYINWPWSGQMEFLKDSLSLRKTTSNILDDRPVDMEEDSVSEETLTLPPASEREEILMDPLDAGESEETQMLPPAKKRRSSMKEDISDVSRVLSYLKERNEKKSNTSHDRIDNLFLSYADTFKSFSARTQANLKMQMAQLFGQAELEELDPRTSTPNPTSRQTSYQSTSTFFENSSDSFTSRNSSSSNNPISNAKEWYEEFDHNEGY